MSRRAVKILSRAPSRSTPVAPISSGAAQREETDMVESKPLTANGSIGTWLHHPEGVR